MKKAALIVSSLVAAMVSYGQGTFDLNNLSQNAGAGSPITLADGAYAGDYAGSEFTMHLYWAAGTVADAGSLSLFAGADTAFFGNTIGGGPTIDGAGYFDAANPTLPTAPGTVTVQIRVDGTVNTVMYVGMSTLYQVDLVDPTGVTPRNGLPTLAAFPLNVVPEPSTIALAGLGIAGLLALRRRRS